MKTYFFTVLLFFASGFTFGQNKLTPYYTKAKQPVNDTARANALNYLGKYHINQNQDSARIYVGKALVLSEILGYKKGIGHAKLTQGILESDLGNYPEALELILKATTIAEEIPDYHLLAGCKLNLGNFYIKTGDTDRALEVYKEGIVLCEKHQIFYTHASLLTSYGMGLRIKGDLDSALIYYEKVLEIQYNQIHDSVVIAAIYNNMASLHYAKKDYQTAENYLLESYKINKLMGNQRYMLMNLSNLGELSGDRDLKQSTAYFEEAIAMATKMRSKEALESIYYGMSRVYFNNQKFEKAYSYLNTSLEYKDSLYGEGKQSQMMEISENFKTRQIQDSLQLKEKDLKLSKSNEEAANLKASKTTWQLVGASFILLCILVILFFVYRNSKNQKKINALLQDKNDEINQQKLEIEEKNHELTDSINYAKRIQTALLPSAGFLKKVLGDYFLLFKPKDIVSGDFYWVKQKGSHHYFAVADCTGHGVPGAMVSMLGYETIEKVSLNEITDAAEFVSKVNEALVTSLSSKSDEKSSGDQQVKDGMDLSLCIVTAKQKLSYCGANNECYIIRKNGNTLPTATSDISIFTGEKYSIIELKPTKRPVGFYHAEHEFKSVELQLLKDDMFYLFSDGYADQFGGDKGKKMKTSTFRDVLLQNADKSMTEQQAILRSYLENWMSNFDQLDDITVLGVRIE